MRIISGSLKGRNIKAPSSIKARPTTDFAKTALFNILENEFDLSTCHVLDIFAGTGNISIEFFSRGAAHVTCVDISFASVNFIRNFCTTHGIKNITVIKNEAFKYLSTEKNKYDIIFCDPPYELDGIEKLALIVFQNDLLKEEGVLIVEHGAKTDLSGLPHFDRHRKYGNVNFSFFRKNKPQ